VKCKVQPGLDNTVSDGARYEFMGMLPCYGCDELDVATLKSPGHAGFQPSA